ncbi:MAG: transporter [Agromyces sp.]|nr:transporter [Agromyces sp.]
MQSTSTQPEPQPPAQPERTALRGQFGQVLLATFASTMGFWAWMVIAPLQKTYATELGLDEGQISLMLAMPVLVGALGRIVVGALADRFGGRKMFTFVLLGAVPPVLLVALAGVLQSFPLLLVAGFLLGVAGTIFAVGVPFSSAWYDAKRRGFATGVFGMGMIGTAVSAFFTPRLAESIGYLPTHLLIAAIMVATAIVVWMFLRDSPAWEPSRQALIPKVMGALRLRITWEMSFLYAIVFGGFVAFATFLPKYLTTIYPDDVDPIGAGTRTALFAVAAVIARPIGGVLSDRFGAKIVSLVSLAGIVSLAYVVGQQPPEGIVTGMTFIAMAGRRILPPARDGRDVLRRDELLRARPVAARARRRVRARHRRDAAGRTTRCLTGADRWSLPAAVRPSRQATSPRPARSLVPTVPRAIPCRHRRRARRRTC